MIQIEKTDTGYRFSLSANGLTVETGHEDTQAKALKAAKSAEAFMRFDESPIEDELRKLGLV